MTKTACMKRNIMLFQLNLLFVERANCNYAKVMQHKQVDFFTLGYLHTNPKLT